VAVRRFAFSEAPDVAVKILAYVIQLMKDDFDFFRGGKVKKTRHIKIYQIELDNPVDGNLRHAVQPSPVADDRGPVFELQGDQLAVKAAPAAPVRGNAHPDPVRVNVMKRRIAHYRLIDDMAQGI